MALGMVITKAVAIVVTKAVAAIVVAFAVAIYGGSFAFRDGCNDEGCIYCCSFCCSYIWRKLCL